MSLKGFLGNNGTREHGPSIQVLSDDRQKLEATLQSVTRNGWKQIVEIDHENIVVSDPGHAGRKIEPLQQVLQKL